MAGEEISRGAFGGAHEFPTAPNEMCTATTPSPPPSANACLVGVGTVRPGWPPRSWRGACRRRRGISSTPSRRSSPSSRMCSGDNAYRPLFEQIGREARRRIRHHHDGHERRSSPASGRCPPLHRRRRGTWLSRAVFSFDTPASASALSISSATARWAFEIPVNAVGIAASTHNLFRPQRLLRSTKGNIVTLRPLGNRRHGPGPGHDGPCRMSARGAPTASEANDRDGPGG